MALNRLRLFSLGCFVAVSASCLRCTELRAQDAVAPSAAFIGSVSCGSATCHGGAIGRGPMWNQSLTLYKSLDPHTGAGFLLHDEDSRRIVGLLEPSADTPLAYDQVLRERCISCHLTATAEDIASEHLLDPRKLAEGVSCESCHGPAATWLEAHVSAEWTGPMRLEPHTAMRDSESIVGRAETCVRCHVGSRVSDGVVRDMNHDLIAAGHPALRFDLMTYSDNLPRHWDQRGASERFAASNIRQRDTGRRVALAAAASLSAQRAAAQVDDPSVPWPELSDYDCFSCHQSLKPKMYALRSITDKDAWREVSDGLPMWNAWHARDLLGLDVVRLRRLAPAAVRPAELAQAANSLADQYRTEAARLEAASAPDPYLRIAEEIDRLRDATPADWHSAAILYLNLEAAVSDLAADQATAGIARRYGRVLRQQVAPMLRFPSASDASARWTSPRDFDSRTFRDTTLQAMDSAEDGNP